VASASASGDSSRQRDTPRREAVASCSPILSGLKSHNPHKSNLSATEMSAADGNNGTDGDGKLQAEFSLCSVCSVVSVYSVISLLFCLCRVFRLQWP
ncbi:MAG TPA: hypothetical protein VNQ79_11920, partial [Blastocatellia bacterium]|nr:hypothetical protein [Blastocatellia bacterium]